MTPLEIIIILTGFIIVLLSFFLGKKKEESVAHVQIDTEKELIKIEQDVKKKLESVSSNFVSEAEEALDKLCNEKIMAVDEFSSQVLERIEHNNSEVIFLYNMFQQKEEEIKKIMHQMDAARRETGTVLEHASSVIKQVQKNNDEMGKSETAVGQSEKQQTSSLTANKQSDTIQDADSDFNKDHILSLHQQKKSIVEISKQLGIGQGEVKLVIDLYGH